MSQQQAQQQSAAQATPAAEASASTQRTNNNTNNKSWGRRRNTGNRIPPTNVNAPGALNSGGTVKPIPQGQYLSKTSSDLTNDPLSQKAYFPGPSEEFRAVAQRQKIYPGCSALPVICEETYNRVTSTSPSYAKQVPRGAHDYYIAVAVYYRLLFLHKRNGGEVSLGELNFLEMFEQAQYVQLKTVALYLSGMGNTKAPKSREVSFGFMHPPLISGVYQFGESGEIEIPGFFGRIDENLGMYSSYPCLGVYASKIAQDLLRTRYRDRVAEWDLPDEFSYLNHPVNQNCLGYRDSVILTSEHQMFYQNCNVSINEFTFENSELPINNEILTAVLMKLTQVRVPLYPIPRGSMGSVGQLPCEVVDFQTTKRATTATYRATTAFEMPSAEGWLGSAFLYNVRKFYDDLGLVKSMMPVRYARNSAVPLDQVQSLNLLYDRTVDWIKVELYAVIPFSPTIRIESIVEKDVKE